MGTREFGETAASRRWREMVVAERMQSERARDDAPEQDFWRRLARRFVPKDAGERQDPTVVALQRIVKPTDTVLDVGAGGGRLAVPLARHCKKVVAVEPSESMRTQLAESIARNAGGASRSGRTNRSNRPSRSRLSNVQVVPSDWLSADVESADVVVCAHVVYAIDDIEPFVRKLDASARRTVAVVLQPRPPMSNFYPLWELVHGEPRRSLPSLPEFLEMLQSWRIRYDVEALESNDLNLFADFQDAVDYSMQRLFIGPDSPKKARLEAVLKDVLVESDGGLRFRWAKPFVPRIVSWEPR